jgi:hypothetical protein
MPGGGSDSRPSWKKLSTVASKKPMGVREFLKLR